MNFNGFLETLPIMGKGMLGIFIVTGVIILCVYALNAIFSPKNKKSGKDGEDK